MIKSIIKSMDFLSSSFDLQKKIGMKREPNKIYYSVIFETSIWVK
jgi:hypothetical protein